MLKKSFNINLEKRMKNNDNNTFENLRNRNEKRQECSVCNSSDDGSEKGVNSRLCFNACVVCMITKQYFLDVQSNPLQAMLIEIAMYFLRKRKFWKTCKIINLRRYADNPDW